MNNRKIEFAKYIFSGMVPVTILAFFLGYLTIRDIGDFIQDAIRPSIYDYVRIRLLRDNR